MPKSPTNGELAVMLGGLTSEIRAGMGNVHETMTRVETKLDHTNGRVRKLEQWKFAMFGGMILGNLIIVPIIVSWLIKLFLGN